jgi:hypothetical protein
MKLLLVLALLVAPLFAQSSHEFRNALRHARRDAIRARVEALRDARRARMELAASLRRARINTAREVARARLEARRAWRDSMRNSFRGERRWYF